MGVKNPPPAAAALPPTPSLRLFLYVTAAITGGAIMIVEILGAKMLAPYFGASHFVWTAQIAVTLVALAAGYYAGGWLVDRTPRLNSLYGAILGAAAYLCLTVRVVEPVSYWSLRFHLATGSLLTSAFLYFVPLALLAMVGPFMVRTLTVSLAGVGGNMGRLTAVSTLGSFVGTLLIGYVLIPHARNSVTMFCTAGLLIIVSVVYFAVWGGARPPAAGVVVVVLGLVFGVQGMQRDNRTSFPFGEQIYRANSNFGQLQVLRLNSGRRLYYLNDYLTQNTYDPESRQSGSMFTYMLHGLARAYSPRVDDVLCIGLGVGIVPMRFAREGARVDVFEINPVVVPLAQSHFDLEPSKLNLHYGDGRHLLHQTTKQYDAVVLDAFLGDSSPSHLMTREAFTDIRRVLKPGSPLVINSFGEREEGHDFFMASLDKTLKSVFKSVHIHAAENGNVFFVAADIPELKMLNQPDLVHIHPACQEDVIEAFSGTHKVDASHGIILTDDYNPVEFYDASNRENLRRQLALGMRRE
jgi:spermidine synthase